VTTSSRGAGVLPPREDSAESPICATARGARGYLPPRRRTADKVPVPALDSYADFALKADGKEMSTTMAAVRLFGNLLKDKALGPRIVPIVADEARTFGMANLFRQVGIYSPVGQLYEPEDAGTMLYYRRRSMGSFWRKASRRPARSRHGPPPPPPTAPTTRRCCPSTSIIRCSASSESAT